MAKRNADASANSASKRQNTSRYDKAQAKLNIDIHKGYARVAGAYTELENLHAELKRLNVTITSIEDSEAVMTDTIEPAKGVAGFPARQGIINVTAANDPVRLAQMRRVIQLETEEVVYKFCSPLSHEGFSQDLFDEFLQRPVSKSRRDDRLAMRAAVAEIIAEAEEAAHKVYAEKMIPVIDAWQNLLDGDDGDEGEESD